MMKGKKVLVISAHAADYVWRAGGTIAKYIKHGADVHAWRECSAVEEGGSNI